MEKHKHILCTFSLPFFVLLSTSITSAQEFTREPQYVKDSFSIVRELPGNQWIIANSYYFLTTFTLLHEQDTISKMNTYWDIFFLSDFELLDDRFAFYCGAGANGAKLGYFDAFKMFDGCPDYHDCVDIGTVTGLARFKKMDLYKDYYSLVHIILTGVKFDGTECIVEVICPYPPSNSWSLYLATDLALSTNIYDDVAVTDNYVVITARNSTTGLLYSFGKPTAYSVFYYPQSKYFHALSFNDTIMVKTCIKDSIVMASHNIGSSTVVVSAADLSLSLPLIATIAIPYSVPDQQLHLRDLAYIPFDNSTQVLTNVWTPNYNSSCVVPVDGSCIYGATVIGHTFKYSMLTSIIKTHFQPYFVLCSGHPNDWANVLRIYRFCPFLWQDCTLPNEFKLVMVSNSMTFQSPTIPTQYYQISVDDYHGDCYKRPEHNICETITK